MHIRIEMENSKAFAKIRREFDGIIPGKPTYVSGNVYYYSVHFGAQAGGIDRIYDRLKAAGFKPKIVMETD